MQTQISYGGAMDWQRSPARGVRRKRLFHSGEAEGGVVTSIVEYAAGSEFPEHGHPEGEEMLVRASPSSRQPAPPSPMSAATSREAATC